MPLAGLLRNLPEWTLRRPCAGKGQGDASITAAQVLLEPEGAGGVPGSPSTPDQDPGCWDGDVLPPHLSGPFLCLTPLPTPCSAGKEIPESLQVDWTM